MRVAVIFMKGEDESFSVVVIGFLQIFQIVSYVFIVGISFFVYL